MSDNEAKVDEVVEMSSDSEPEDFDLDELNEIKVDATDLDELDQLIMTTKQDLSTILSIKRRRRNNSQLKSIPPMFPLTFS